MSGGTYNVRLVFYDDDGDVCLIADSAKDLWNPSHVVHQD